MHPLALSPFALVSALGTGEDAHLRRLQAGNGALRPCRFETVDIPTFVGEVEGIEDARLPPELAAYDCRNNRLAEMACRQEAFADAVAAAISRHGPARIGVFLGTSTSGILETEIAYRVRETGTGALPGDFAYAETHNTFSVAAYVRARFGITGPSAVISAACASTAKAFGNAARMIEAGLCDAAIVGGADSLCLTTLYGFRSLGLTSEHPCKPFDVARDGISIGEGAGFVVVERANGHGETSLLGIGESSDAYHMSSPHPEGLGARMAMERALVSADLDAASIGYVKLHGTATTVGDAAEDKAITAMFGRDTPCSSLKGHVGHTLGASGILEAGMAALALRHGLLPGTIGTDHLDPACTARHLLTVEARPVERAMCNSFGFGGSNCSLVLGRC